MNHPFPLHAMSDAELVQHAEALRSDLTSTELEIELTRRLAAALDLASFAALAEEYGDAEALQTLVESHPGSLADQAELLGVLTDREIHTAEALLEQLGQRDALYQIASDAGDTLERLAKLTSSIL